MKKKTINYILGFAVLLIWGLIFYKIVSAVWGDDEPLPVTTAPQTEKAYNDFEFKKDTTKLNLHYRDPFKLSSVHTADTTKRQPVTRARIIPAPAPVRIDWSFIKYSGYIANPVTKKIISILTINGKSAMLREGESAGQVKLLKNLRDSVKISFKNKTQYIPRNTAAL